MDSSGTSLLQGVLERLLVPSSALSVSALQLIGPLLKMKAPHHSGGAWPFKTSSEQLPSTHTVLGAGCSVSRRPVPVLLDGS